MFKRAVTTALAAMLISIPAIAGAASGKRTAVKPHHVAASVKLVNVSPPGNVVVPGTQTYAGTVDGSITGAAFSGAIRGRNTYAIIPGSTPAASFTGTLTVFAPQGSWVAKVTGKGTAAADGSLSYNGSGTVTKGTGAFKGAKGNFTFTGAAPPKDADNDSDAVAGSFSVAGVLRY